MTAVLTVAAVVAAALAYWFAFRSPVDRHGCIRDAGWPAW